MRDDKSAKRRDWAGLALWLPGLLVGVGAAAATAHGLYEVAAGAGVPRAIAWLYPLITDGLALVAYAATARLEGGDRRYAWTVVVVAAGLSGLAQASYLAGGVVAAAPVLRFGVGAWPAIAAAIVAHLLFLLGTRTPASAESAAETTPSTVQPPREAGSVQRSRSVQREPLNTAVQPSRDVQPPGAVQPPPQSVRPSERSAAQKPPAGSDERLVSSLPSPASDRARAAARRYAAEHGHLPTVSELMDLSDVSRGSAGTVLKALREQPAHLHVVHDDQPHEGTNP